MGNLQAVPGLLGLAARAGMMASGAFMAEKRIRAGGAALALLDGDASPSTREDFQALCAKMAVPFRVLPPGMLSQAIGKPGRMTAVIAPGGLSQRLLLELDPMEPQCERTTRPNGTRG
jgi:ribosomal protein L7Ae-like RNA K-turn-binding protein